MAELIVEMTSEPIELCKLLKIADLVSGGGEAKVVISEGYVSLNGEIEYQKRKKIYHGDVIAFNGDYIEFNVVEALDEPEVDESTKNFTEANYTEANYIKANAEDNSQNTDYSSPFQKSDNYKHANNAKSAPKQNKGKPKSNAQPNTKKSTNSAPKQEKSKRRPISF